MISLFELKELTSSLAKSQNDIEQFYVTYSGIRFDIIYDIGRQPFEMLIGALGYNWATVLYIEKGYKTQMNSSDFFALCNILKLKPSKESLTSYKFIKAIARHIPKKCSNRMVDPAHFIPFVKRKIRIVEEENKIYFKGWNDHLIDKQTAHNFSKTEMFFGKTVADYCRVHNISSLWTYIEPKNVKITHPWDI